MSNTLQLNRVAQLGVSIATGVEFNVIVQQQRSSVRDSHAQPVIGFGGVNVIKSFFYLRQARYILVVLVLVVLVVVQTDVVAVEAVTAYDLCLIPQFQCSSGSQLLRCRVDDDSIGDIVRPVTILSFSCLPVFISGEMFLCTVVLIAADLSPHSALLV